MYISIKEGLEEVTSP